ncbi:protein-export chaperone SecB [Vibrio sp. K4]|uniref:protein-export chaperone SecB n=1 Tax=Vibrio sp. K4 TaxID=3391579 RepID=UPI003DA76152
MKLKLKSCKAENIYLVQSNQVDDFSELKNFEMEYGCGTNEETPDMFFVFFNIKLKVEDSHLLDIEYRANFETDSEINESFKDSSFSKVNAPAIAFPYIRAFISTFLLNAGFEPIILPSFNFVALGQQESKDN